MTMFDGLTMVSYDGHNRNKMMVDHVRTMVDHGRPWSGGQMFAGEFPSQRSFEKSKNTEVCLNLTLKWQHSDAILH